MTVETEVVVKVANDAFATAAIQSVVMIGV